MPTESSREGELAFWDIGGKKQVVQVALTRKLLFGSLSY